MSSNKIIIRDGTVDDLDQVHAMLLMLKSYLSNDAKPPTLEVFRRDSGLLDDNGIKFFRLFVAEDTSTKKLVGYTLYYYMYKTQAGKFVYVQDLFAQESARKTGVGSLLLRRAAKKTLEVGAIGMELHARKWNPARKFYEAHGGHVAVEEEVFLRYDFSLEAVKKLAESCP